MRRLAGLERQRRRPASRGGWRAVVAAALLVGAAPARAETRPAESVFHKWIDWQMVRADVAPAAVGAKLDNAFVAKLRTGVPAAMGPQLGFLRLPPAGRPATAAETAACLEAVRGVSALIDHRFDAFVALLARSGFGSAPLDAAEQRYPPTLTYRRFWWALLDRGDLEGEATRTLAFAVANRAFDWSFRPPTHAWLRALISQPEGRPIVRLLYELMRHFLARTGWAHWHESALAGLAREAAKGREVVYVGGGTDVYQLLRRGIHRVRVIDPLLPTQTRFYADGWEFLAKGAGRDGGVGDEIVFGAGGAGPKLKLRRTSYVEHGVLADVMVPRPGGKGRVKVPVPRSTTVWTIVGAGGATLGTLTFERRFARNDDFRVDRAMLMSFNELYFVVSTRRDSWELDPAVFPKGVVIHVKQLRRPVDHATLMNLRTVQGSELPFTFGSEVY